MIFIEMSLKDIICEEPLYPSLPHQHVSLCQEIVLDPHLTEAAMLGMIVMVIQGRMGEHRAS